MSFSPRYDPRFNKYTMPAHVPVGKPVDVEFVDAGGDDEDNGLDDSKTSKVDPSKLLITSEGELDSDLLVRREGWLWKKGGAINLSKFSGRRNWKQRWFELKPIQFFGKTAYEIHYWESEKKKKLLGAVSLNEVEIFREAKSKTQEERHEFQLLLQNGNIFHLAAESVEEREEWVETLNIVIAYTKKLSAAAGLILGVDGYDPSNEDIFSVYKKGEVFAQNCQAFGAGLFGTEAGQKGKFAIVLRDSNGDQLTHGGMPMTISIFDDECLYYLRVNDHLNGTYSAHYVLAKPGKYKLRICINDEHDIFGSPFDLTVLPSRTVPARCTAEGHALKEVFAGGLINSFTIIARDDFGNRKPRGGETFEVGVMGPAKLRKLTDNGNGTYKCSFDVEDPGDLGYYASSSIMLMVTLHGKHVLGSPFKPSIVPYVPHLHSQLVTMDDTDDAEKAYFAHQFNADHGSNKHKHTNDLRKSVLNHPVPSKESKDLKDFSHKNARQKAEIDVTSLREGKTKSTLEPGAGRKEAQIPQRLNATSAAGVVGQSHRVHAVPATQLRDRAGPYGADTDEDFNSMNLKIQSPSKENIGFPHSARPTAEGARNNATRPQTSPTRAPVSYGVDAIKPISAGTHRESDSGASPLERARQRALLARQAKEVAHGHTMPPSPPDDLHAEFPYTHGGCGPQGYQKASRMVTAESGLQRPTSQMSVGGSSCSTHTGGSYPSTPQSTALGDGPAKSPSPPRGSPTNPGSPSSGSPSKFRDRISRLESLNKGPGPKEDTLKKLSSAQDRLRQAKKQQSPSQPHADMNSYGIGTASPAKGYGLDLDPDTSSQSSLRQEFHTSPTLRRAYDPSGIVAELRRGLVDPMPPTFGPWEQSMWKNTNAAIRDPEVLPLVVANLTSLRGVFDTVARDSGGLRVLPLSTQSGDQGGALRIMELYDICTLIPKREAKLSFNVVLVAQRNTAASANRVGGGGGLDFAHFVKLLILLAMHCNSKHANLATAYPTPAAKVECMLFNWGLGDPAKLIHLSKRLNR